MAVDQAQLQQQLQDFFALQTNAQQPTGGFMGGNPNGAYNMSTGGPGQVQTAAGSYPLPANVSYYDNTPGYMPPTSNAAGDWNIPALPSQSAGFSDFVMQLLQAMPRPGLTGPIDWGTPTPPPGGATTPPPVVPPGGTTPPPGVVGPQPPGGGTFWGGGADGNGGPQTGPASDYWIGSNGLPDGPFGYEGPNDSGAPQFGGSFSNGGASMPSWLQGGDLNLGGLGQFLNQNLPNLAQSLGIQSNGSIDWRQIADFVIPGNAFNSNTGQWDASNVIAKLVSNYSGLPVSKLLGMAGKTQANQDDPQNVVERALTDHYMDNVRNTLAANPAVSVELGRYGSGQFQGVSPNFEGDWGGFTPNWAGDAGTANSSGTGGRSVGGAGSQWGSGWGGASFGAGQGPTGNGYGSGFGSGSSFGGFGEGWGGSAPTNDWGAFTPTGPATVPLPGTAPAGPLPGLGGGGFQGGGMGGGMNGGGGGGYVGTVGQIGSGGSVDMGGGFSGGYESAAAQSARRRAAELPINEN